MAEQQRQHHSFTPAQMQTFGDAADAWAKELVHGLEKGGAGQIPAAAVATSAHAGRAHALASHSSLLAAAAAHAPGREGVLKRLRIPHELLYDVFLRSCQEGQVFNADVGVGVAPVGNVSRYLQDKIDRGEKLSSGEMVEGRKLVAASKAEFVRQVQQAVVYMLDVPAAEELVDAATALPASVRTEDLAAPEVPIWVELEDRHQIELMDRLTAGPAAADGQCVLGVEGAEWAGHLKVRALLMVRETMVFPDKPMAGKPLYRVDPSRNVLRVLLLSNDRPAWSLVYDLDRKRWVCYRPDPCPCVGHCRFAATSHEPAFQNLETGKIGELWPMPQWYSIEAYSDNCHCYGTAEGWTRLIWVLLWYLTSPNVKREIVTRKAEVRTDVPPAKKDVQRDVVEEAARWNRTHRPRYQRLTLGKRTYIRYERDPVTGRRRRILEELPADAPRVQVRAFHKWLIPGEGKPWKVTQLVLIASFERRVRPRADGSEPGTHRTRYLVTAEPHVGAAADTPEEGSERV